MTPKEFEWAHEQAEISYERGEIGPEEFRKRMRSLGASDDYIDELLSDMDRLIALHPH